MGSKNAFKTNRAHFGEKMKIEQKSIIPAKEVAEKRFFSQSNSVGGRWWEGVAINNNIDRL